MSNQGTKTVAPAATDKPKAKDKPKVNVTQFPAKTLKSGFEAFNNAVLSTIKAAGAASSALQGIGLYLLATYGVSVCTERNSSAAKTFASLWDDNYAKLIEKAPAGDRDALANQKGVYKGRALRFAAMAAISQGKAMTGEQREKADDLIKKYDANKNKKKGKIEARTYKARVTEEVTALYKFHMKEDWSGVSSTKAADIGKHLGNILILLGVDLSSLNEDA